MSCSTPILFCIFNRPAVTAKTFAAIAQQKPKNLLIVGDGPRGQYPNDFELVQQTRKVIERVDWDCNLQACFSNENVGCRRQMARAISWGFEQFERLIILEDDCLPDPSFYSFCEELLERYADRPEVMTIGGINHLDLGCPYDYRFSKYPLIWGWASWRRAWQHFDLEMSAWQDSVVRNSVLEQFTQSESERAYWKRLFDSQAAGGIDTWDYSWTFASWLGRGLTIVPRTNLVTNIGFGASATHTVDAASPLADRATAPLKLTNHPPRIERDLAWDGAAKEFYFPIGADSPEPVIFPAKRSFLKRLIRSGNPFRRAA